MKRLYITTLATCLAILLAFSAYYAIWEYAPELHVLTVGFLYENDASAPYSYNVSLGQEALEQLYGDNIRIHTLNNVLENETTEPLRELAREGCDIIFASTFSDQVMGVAEEFPETQFCQVACRDPRRKGTPDNYHTYNAEIYQARYVSGIAAGMKLRELIDDGTLKPEEALVGFVCPSDTSSSTSSYTAFLLGVRSVAPEARMLLKYTRVWNGYIAEKPAAEALIAAGCRIIAQNTHSIGPVAACEEACAEGIQVYNVGYSRSMLDIAPAATLVGLRANWVPYMTGAVEAVLAGEDIEAHVPGNAHGNDLSGGFDHGWVQMLEINPGNAAEGTQAQMDKAIEQIRRGRLSVFKGDYLGVDMNDEEDSIDLNNGYVENAATSYPTFHYRLKDYISVIA